MSTTSPTIQILKQLGIPYDERNKAFEAKREELDKGFAELYSESKSRPLSTIEVSDNLESLDDFKKRGGIQVELKGKDNEQQINLKGALQRQRTDAKIQQQESLTKNAKELLAIPAGVLDNQSAERSGNLEKILGYGTTENAADRELRKRGMTQDLLTKLALGAAIAFG